MIGMERPPLSPGSGENILLVEDDNAVRAALAEWLESLNYQVLQASNGQEALIALAQNAQDEDAPHIQLVLSDVVMPEMGGVALFHAMRAAHPAIGMILLTGHAVEQELEPLLALGLRGWISKPPNIAQLTQLIAQSLSTQI